MLTSSLSLRVVPVKAGSEAPGPYVQPGSPPAVLAQARREINLLMEPAPDHVILTELSALSRRVAPRSSGDEDEQANAAAQLLLCRLLQRYPQDIAVAAIRGWPDTPPPASKFWPVDSELRAQCDALVDYRARLKAAIDDACAAAETDAGEEYRNEPHGFTRRLYDEAVRIRGKDWAFAWLNRRRCLFSSTEVITTEVGAAILKDALSGVAKSLKVTISAGAIVDGETHANARLGARQRADKASLAFLADLRKAKGVEWVETYTTSARFGDGVIGLRGIEFIRVREHGGSLASGHGVEIVEYR